MSHSNHQVKELDPADGRTKTFTMTMDETFDRNLEELKSIFGKSSKAEALRFAVALMRVAGDAKQQGLKLAVADSNDKVLKEILLP